MIDLLHRLREVPFQQPPRAGSGAMPYPKVANLEFERRGTGGALSSRWI
jgi:hypothetical protein